MTVYTVKTFPHPITDGTCLRLACGVDVVCDIRPEAIGNKTRFLSPRQRTIVKVGKRDTTGESPDDSPRTANYHTPLPNAPHGPDNPICYGWWQGSFDSEAIIGYSDYEAAAKLAAAFPALQAKIEGWIEIQHQNSPIREWYDSL